MKLTHLTLALLGLAACKQGGAQPGGASSQPAASPAASPDAPAPAGASITVTLEAKSGSTLAGTAVFTDAGSGVKVVIDVSGISPGKHGAHVHEKPDCSAEDGSSAGGHYNPHNKEHALPPTGGHIGDLGNIEVGADGKGHHEITIAEANLKAGDVSSYRERAIIIHAAPDDGGQPTGNAGGRVGCGVIR